MTPPDPSQPLLHSRQLVVGPEPVAPRPDWVTLPLGAGVWLSHCPRLRCHTVQDQADRRWALLGRAVQTLPAAREPIQAIAAAPREAVPRSYESWSGRWLLVSANEVHLDASGLLGCFFASDGQGRGWASSSPALLAATTGAAIVGDGRELRHERGFSWFPPPRSRFERIRRLLPSQVLDLATGSVRPRPLLPELDPARGYERTLALLGEALVTGLTRLAGSGEPISLSLSAGLDSRVVLAAAERAGIDYVPFTRIATRMRSADRFIPPALTRAVDRELEWYRRGRRRRARSSAERLPLVMAHSAGHVSVGDAQPLLEGTRDGVVGISLSGVAFGVGKALEREKLPAAIEDPDHDAERLALAKGETRDSAAIAGLREWMHWCARTPQDHLDWRDRLYIEQRLAGWQSSKEQVYDLVGVERFAPINSARCYAFMLEIDERRRREQRHQRDLVARLCPSLAGFPVNPTARELGLARVFAAKMRDDPRGAVEIRWRRFRRRWRARHGRRRRARAS